jgi:hypothetical protein
MFNQSEMSLPLNVVVVSSSSNKLVIMTAPKAFEVKLQNQLVLCVNKNCFGFVGVASLVNGHFTKQMPTTLLHLKVSIFFVVSFAILLLSMVVIYDKNISGKKCLMSYKMNNGTLTMKKQVECEHFNIDDKNLNGVAQIQFSSIKFFFIKIRVLRYRKFTLGSTFTIFW